MMVVVVTSRLREGCMAEFLAACAELKPQVLAEEGCLGYEHLVGVSWPPGSDVAVDPDQVVLIETWESEAALRGHGGVAHGKVFAQRVRPLRESVAVAVFRSALPPASDQLDPGLLVQSAGLVGELGIGDDPPQR